MRVLVVKDEVRLAEKVASALREGPNFAVDCAEDGLTGLHLAENRCYDLIILDLMLPGLDGLGLLRKVRAGGDGTPVLILTAKGESSSIISLLNAGADDYLSKPFDLGELIARAREWPIPCSASLISKSTPSNKLCGVPASWWICRRRNTAFSSI